MENVITEEEKACEFVKSHKVTMTEVITMKQVRATIGEANASKERV